MNRISRYLSLLKFSVTNPKIGIEILHGAKQAKIDQSQPIKEHVVKFASMIDSLNLIFPDSEVSVDDIKSKLNPLKEHMISFFSHIELKNFPSKEKPYPTDYSLDNNSGIFLYVLCKILKPEKVIETGVAYGHSSSYILQALNENQKGELFSIDSVFRPWESKEMIGSAIPDYLRERWHFIFGPSSSKLNKLLQTVQNIDIFIHDSLHTYDNMIFEFNTAWPYIKNNGLLLSDDILDNNAFYDFYSSLKLKPIIMQEKGSRSAMGIIKK